MKFKAKKWMYTVCSLLLASPTFIHWHGVSVIFFGELPYPTETEE